MINKILKNKKYNVMIIYKDRVEIVEALARSKREAKQVVSNILINCNLFKVQTPNEFQLKVINERRG